MAFTREPGEDKPTLTREKWQRMVADAPIQAIALPSATQQQILDLVESTGCTPEQLAEILAPFLPPQ